MATLQGLPIDVLLDIYQLLSVKDLINLGRTCTYLWKSTYERSAWLVHHTTLESLFPLPPSTSTPTERLKEYAIRQARVDATWHDSASSRARECTEVYRAPKFSLFELKLLPGGNYVVVIFCEGSVDLRSTMFLEEHDREPLFKAPMCEQWYPIDSSVLQCVVFHVSESAGYVALELYHSHTIHRHIRVFAYHVDSTSRRLEMIQDYLWHEEVYAWGFLDGVMAVLYDFEDPTIFFTDLSKTGQHFPPACTLKPISCEALEIGHIIMVSQHRFLLTHKGPSISVYDVPLDLESHEGAHLRIPIQHIWRWTSDIGSPRRPMAVSPTSYDARGSGYPLIRITDGRTLHTMRLSVSSPSGVEEHNLTQLERRIKNSNHCFFGHRHMFTWRNTGQDMILEMVHIPLGSIKIRVEGAARVTLVLWDELSGRIVLVRDDGWVMVVDS